MKIIFLHLYLNLACICNTYAVYSQQTISTFVDLESPEDAALVYSQQTISTFVDLKSAVITQTSFIPNKLFLLL